MPLLVFIAMMLNPAPVYHPYSDHGMNANGRNTGVSGRMQDIARPEPIPASWNYSPARYDPMFERQHAAHGTNGGGHGAGSR